MSPIKHDLDIIAFMLVFACGICLGAAIGIMIEDFLRTWTSKSLAPWIIQKMFRGRRLGKGD